MCFEESASVSVSSLVDTLEISTSQSVDIWQEPLCAVYFGLYLRGRAVNWADKCHYSGFKESRIFILIRG